MREKFADFDAYQLAKYNKEKSRLAKNKPDFKHVRTQLKTDPTLLEDKFTKVCYL